MRAVMFWWIIALLVGLSVAGCTTNSTEIPQVTLPDAREVKSTVCQALESVKDTVRGLTTVNPETQVNDIKQLRQNVSTWVEAIRRANTVLQMQQMSELVTAYDRLGASIDQLNADQKVGDAAAAVRGGATDLAAALERAYAVLECSQ
ncbi:MAG: hypothetical protein H3C34_13180 [Caldilineaceae bacterium]|nr:hypothetical protein [Caldilineaceae bacterium]